MNKTEGIISLIVIILVAVLIYSAVTPDGRASWNNWWFDVQKADDATNYETLKIVEDTCRASIASYTAKSLIYEQYKDSESKEERSWASGAKMMANNIASTYNQYILENKFVWKDAIPLDIKFELPYLK